MISTPAQRAKVIRIVRGSKATPPRFIEYAYYLSLFYGIMGSALGLPGNFLGGGTLLVLAVLCIMSLRSRALIVCAQIWLPLGCAISFVLLQVLVHREPLMAARSFIIWILLLIIIQSLCLRQGFLHRFAFVIFGIGLLTLPYMQSPIGNFGLQRAEIDRTIVLSNANELGAWFGFCVVYFMIVGLEAKRNTVRIAAWVIAVGSLFVVGLTVSRGTLLAVVVATVIALRRLLKYGFVPILFLIVIIWIIYEVGVFERSASFYAARGLQETGRLLVWPLVLERFLSSPLAGVGLSDIATYIPGRREPITPHNSFLFVALASGIIPLAFFVSYWWRAAKGAFRGNAEQLANMPFQVPLLTYAFLVVHQSNASFMLPWVVVILSTAIAAGVSGPVRPMVVPQLMRGQTTASMRRRRGAGSAPVGYQFCKFPPRS